MNDVHLDENIKQLEKDISSFQPPKDDSTFEEYYQSQAIKKIMYPKTHRPQNQRYDSD